jgi:hypothetical protein
MSFPWSTVSGWVERRIDTPRSRPFAIEEVDASRGQVLVRNYQGKLRPVAGRDLEAVYKHALIHGPVRTVDVDEILNNPQYRCSTYTAAIVNELLRERN